MRLSFLGAHYETQLPELQAETEEKIGTYRGAPMKRKHFRLSHQDHGRVELTYRGVKYSHEV